MALWRRLLVSQRWIDCGGPVAPDLIRFHHPARNAPSITYRLSISLAHLAFLNARLLGLNELSPLPSVVFSHHTGRAG